LTGSTKFIVKLSKPSKVYLNPKRLTAQYIVGNG
jgi:hypothetical protein